MTGSFSIKTRRSIGNSGIKDRNSAAPSAGPDEEQQEPAYNCEGFDYVSCANNADYKRQSCIIIDNEEERDKCIDEANDAALRPQILL